VTLGHPSPLKKINGVMLLGQKEAVRGARDRDAKEVVESTEVCHGELGAEPIGDAPQKGRGRRRQDDVVDVEQQVSDIISIFINKETCRISPP
jgi:hypothetical protein